MCAVKWVVWMWQRPETVESLFVMYRLTKNESYREWGWEMFEAWQKYCKVRLSPIWLLPPSIEFGHITVAMRIWQRSISGCCKGTVRRVCQFALGAAEAAGTGVTSF